MIVSVLNKRFLNNYSLWRNHSPPFSKRLFYSRLAAKVMDFYWGFLRGFVYLVTEDLDQDVLFFFFPVLPLNSFDDE